jgi:hypothetical protein
LTNHIPADYRFKIPSPALHTIPISDIKHTWNQICCHIRNGLGEAPHSFIARYFLEAASSPRMCKHTASPLPVQPNEPANSQLLACPPTVLISKPSSLNHRAHAFSELQRKQSVPLRSFAFSCGNCALRPSAPGSQLFRLSTLNYVSTLNCSSAAHQAQSR